MLLYSDMEDKYGHVIAMKAWDACRKALKKHEERIKELENLVQMNVEYKLLEHLDNSWILESFDREKRYSRIDFEEDKLNRKINAHLDELLEKEAEEYLLNMRNDHVKHRRILKTKCFGDDEERTNDFIDKLSHVSRSAELAKLIEDTIGLEVIEQEFDNLPQFVETIMYFIEGRATKVSKDTLRRELAYSIHAE